MARGVAGKSRKTMMRRLNSMPENFLHDLRQLLDQLRRSPDAKLSPLQQQIIQAHRLPLRRFITSQPKLLLSTKRRVANTRMPLVEAIGWLLSDNSKLLENYTNTLQAH